MTDSKPTNPKDAVGIRKYPGSTIPRNVLGELGLAMLEGARKYGRHNYRVAGVRASVYFDACERHMASFWEGEDIDPDSGLSHVTKAIAGLVVLRDSMLRGNWVDDRPPRTAPGWQAELNRKAGEIIDNYPDVLPAHTHVEEVARLETDVLAPFVVTGKIGPGGPPLTEPPRLTFEMLSAEHVGLTFRLMKCERSFVDGTDYSGRTGKFLSTRPDVDDELSLETGPGCCAYFGPGSVLELVEKE